MGGGREGRREVLNRGREKSSEHGACVGFTVIAGVSTERERERLRVPDESFGKGRS